MKTYIKVNCTSLSLNQVGMSVLSIRNLDFIPCEDHWLITAGSFDLYASAGSCFEYILGSFERTTLVNGNKAEYNYMSNIIGDYTKMQAEAVGGTF